MPSPHLIVSRRAVIAVAFLSLLCQVSALNVEYCSSLNTASGDPSKSSMEHRVFR